VLPPTPVIADVKLIDSPAHSKTSEPVVKLGFNTSTVTGAEDVHPEAVFVVVTV
jgi:hypothetical protein